MRCIASLAQLLQHQTAALKETQAPRYWPCNIAWPGGNTAADYAVGEAAAVTGESEVRVIVDVV